MNHIITLLKSAARRLPFFGRLVDDIPFRLRLTLFATLLVNTVYAAFQLVSALLYGSLWYYAMAGYYTLLSVMRFFLLRDIRSYESRGNAEAEYKRYRFCGVCLLIMNLSLAVIVVFITVFERAITHHYFITLIIAAYTVCSLVFSAYNLIKFRKYNSPILTAVKSISLITASVSMLTTETSLIISFGASLSPAARLLFTGVTGAAVCIFVLLVAMNMIIHSTRELGRLRSAKKEKIR